MVLQVLPDILFAHPHAFRHGAGSVDCAIAPASAATSSPLRRRTASLFSMSFVRALRPEQVRGAAERWIVERTIACRSVSVAEQGLGVPEPMLGVAPLGVSSAAAPKALSSPTMILGPTLSNSTCIDAALNFGGRPERGRGLPRRPTTSHSRADFRCFETAAAFLVCKAHADVQASAPSRRATSIDGRR